jgi:hypothetical protein
MKNKNISKKNLKKNLKKASRKNMKGGFWPFTSSKPVDPNQPLPVKKTLWERLFGSKKPVEDTTQNNANVEIKPNPLITSNENLVKTEPVVVPEPVAETEPIVAAPAMQPVSENVVVKDNAVIPQAVENKMMYRGEGGKKRKRNTRKKNDVKQPVSTVVLQDNYPAHNEISTANHSSGGKKDKKKTSKKCSNRPVKN